MVLPEIIESLSEIYYAYERLIRAYETSDAKDSAVDAQIIILNALFDNIMNKK